MGVAVLAQDLDSALQAGLAALGYASGPTVGAFLLGVLTRTASSAGTLVGMAVGLATSLAVGQLAPYVTGRPGVAWTWNVATGAVVTVAVGWTVSRFLGGRSGVRPGTSYRGVQSSSASSCSTPGSATVSSTGPCQNG
jgi:Na+/proline symporter